MILKTENRSQTMGPQSGNKCRYNGQVSDTQERKSKSTETQGEKGRVGCAALDVTWPSMTHGWARFIHLAKWSCLPGTQGLRSVGVRSACDFLHYSAASQPDLEDRLHNTMRNRNISHYMRQKGMGFPAVAWVFSKLFKYARNVKNHHL